MAKPKSKQASKHDRKVGQIARQLKKEGWNVEADLPGFDNPDPIGKNRHVPDIRATKGGVERLIEVETKDTLQGDKEQHATFRRRAGQKSRTTFRIEKA